MSSYSTINHAYNSGAEVLNIRLNRPNNTVSWGFNIQGGKEFSSPLLIQKITPNSLADRCSLKPGDYIIRIGNRSVENFSHNEARNSIIEQGNDLEIVIQRHAVPKQDDFASKHNFTNFQFLNENTDGHQAKASPQVNVQLKDNRVLATQSYNSPLGLYSKENVTNTLVDTIKSAEPNNSNHYSKPLIEKPLSFVPRLNGKIELNSKPKPFKPMNFNQENIKPVSAPIKIQQQSPTTIIDNSIFRAQLVLNNNNSSLSASTNSLKSINSTSDDLNSDSDRAWQSYRIHSEMARSGSSGSVNKANKPVERSLSVNDTKNNFSSSNTNSDVDDERRHWSKIEEIKFKRLQVKKTIQARLAEALAQTAPVLVDDSYLYYSKYKESPPKYDGVNENHSNYFNNQNTQNLRSQLKHLNLNVDDIESASIIQTPASHTSELSPSTLNNNFVQNFSNPPPSPVYQQPPPPPVHHYQPPPPQPIYQAPPQPSPYFNVQAPYQQQYVPPPPARQHQPPQFVPQAVPRPTPVQAPPVNNINNQGQRSLNRGLKGSALRKLDHPTVPTCSACNTVIRGPFISAVGKIWCPNHFTCASCGINLEDIGFIEENGNLYCEMDFEKYFAPKCAKCRKAIVSDCCYAVQKSYHPDCFTCTKCNKKIASGAFHVEDGLPYCVQDYNQLFSAKCAGCNYPIDASDQFVEALNANWHVECFTCTTCHTKLEGIGFVTKSNKPYCKRHAR